MNEFSLFNTLNYGIAGDYSMWLKENWSSLSELETDSYWKEQMNEEEREMRKHPNRSFNWIPNRLRERRSQLRQDLFLYLDHSKVEKPNILLRDVGEQEGCNVCGVTPEEIREYIQDFMERIDYENKDELYRAQKAPLHYDTVKRRVLGEMSNEYSPQVIKASEYFLPDLKTQYISYGLYYDHCHHCYERKMKTLRTILEKDLEKVRSK
jgi:hypothetical protein